MDHTVVQKQLEVFVDIQSYVWRPLLDTLLYLLKESVEEHEILEILTALQDLGAMAGSTRNSAALQSVLKGLCRWALPLGQSR